MNKDLEALVLAYEAVSASRDKEAEHFMQTFEGLLDRVIEQHRGVSRDLLRKSVIKMHRKWALKQEKKPPAIPPRA